MVPLRNLCLFVLIPVILLVCYLFILVCYYIACIGRFLLVTDVLSVVHHMRVLYIHEFTYACIHVYMFPDERMGGKQENPFYFPCDFRHT